MKAKAAAVGALLLLCGFSWLLVDGIGWRNALSAVGAGACLVVFGVAVMLIDWGGGRGKVD